MMKKRLFYQKWIWFLFVLPVLCGAGFLLFHYVPFYLPSYSFWAGAALMGCGCAGFLVFMKRRRMSRAKGAILCAFGGLVLMAAALMWPSALRASNGPHHRLDDFLPRFQCREYHEVMVSGPPDALAKTAPTICLADISAVNLLFHVRALAMGQAYQPDPAPFLEIKPGSGFLVLDDTNPYELVYGMVGRPWTDEPPPAVHTASQFKAFDEPGHIKVAFDIRIADQGNGRACLSTETRVLGSDAQAQKLFSRYWRIIYPGSAIIRRVWLNAIVDKAKKTAGGKGAKAAVGDETDRE